MHPVLRETMQHSGKGRNAATPRQPVGPKPLCASLKLMDDETRAELRGRFVAPGLFRSAVASPGSGGEVGKARQSPATKTVAPNITLKNAAPRDDYTVMH